MAGWVRTATDDKRPEWICREHNVLWSPPGDDFSVNPGCWICGTPGEARPLGGMRPGLAEFGGYGFSDSTVRRD